MENRKLSKTESALIRKYTTVYEYKEIAEKNKTSTSKVTHLLYGYTYLSEANKHLFGELKNKAVENCKKTIIQSEIDSKTLDVL